MQIMSKELCLIVDDKSYKVSETKLKDKPYYQVRIKNGCYKNGKTKYKTVSSNTINDLPEKIKNVQKCCITDINNITIEQLCSEWLKYKFGNIAPATYDKIESVVNSHIKNEIGDFNLENFNAEFLQKYVYRLSKNGNLKTGKGLSYNTIRKIISVLYELNEYAIYKEYLDKNVVKYLEIPKMVKKPEPRKIMSEVELNIFLKELLKKDRFGNYVYYYKNAIMFMLCTGLRTCELFALQWDMVDLENKVVKIERNKIRTAKRSVTGKKIEGYKTIIVDETKNMSSKRYVPLTDMAVNILKEQKEKVTTKVCFPNKDGRIVKQSTFNHNFTRICKNANVNVAPYSLRHTFACNAYYNSKVSLEELSKIMGHSSTKVAYTIYIHQMKEKEKLIADKLEGMYNIEFDKIS